MSVAPARRAALDVLAAVRRRKAYAAPVLDAALERTPLSSEDRRLATRLSYGTLQTRGTLDEAIDRFASRPSRLEPRVRDALRMATYELLFSDTPPRVAVHQGVEAVRAARPQAAGMANAILRRLAAEAETFPWGRPASDIGALARSTGHPVWLAEMLVSDLGHERARRMMEADLLPAPLYLAQLPFLATYEESLRSLADEGVSVTPCDPPGCLLAQEKRAALQSSTVERGLVIVIDAAAQVAPLALDPRPGMRIADLAAGRGGKTALVQARAWDAGGPADVLALDLHEFKTRLLADRMRSLGVPRVTVETGDARNPSALPGSPVAAFDRVLLDAPCSNLGTLRRHPELVWNLSREDPPRMARLQSELLSAAAELVRPGGLVVYSTCSVLQAENRDVVARFLEGSPGFEVRELGEVVTGRLGESVAPDGFFQSTPTVDGPDGHFVAVLRRR